MTKPKRKRPPKFARQYRKRYSHNWTEYFTEKNLARLANRERLVA